jgi:hypothetical protein
MTPLSEDEIIARLQEAKVPEPSPLFWEHLSQRVHDAVATEPLPSRTWFDRVNFAWAGGLAAAALAACFVLVVSRSAPQTTVDTPVAVVASPELAADAGSVVHALPAVEDDASFAVMGELASEIGFEDAGAAGLVVSPASAEDAISQLSGDEQRAMVELLQQEIRNFKSL